MPLARSSPILLALLLLFALAAGPAQAATFTVNSTADVADFSPGDGFCDSNQGAAGEQCTLRAAVDEANGQNDAADFHTINLPAGTYTLTNGVLAVEWFIRLQGAGARTTIIDQATAGARVFEFTTGEFLEPNLISGVTIKGGESSADGGNIRSENSAMTITNSTISGGSAIGGGGISNVFSIMTIRNSTIAANTAIDGHGGGILNEGNVDQSAALIVENSTISGNTATGGGGIQSGTNNPDNSVTVTSSTIAGNTSTGRLGGGLYIDSGTASVRSSIVALNTSAEPLEPNCTRNVSNISLGFNLESSTDCAFKAGGDKQNTNPLIGPLQNNGGPTDTRALLPGSPAIDAGGPTCPTTDQRGVIRPQGPACDIGAFESIVSPDTTIVSGPASFTKDRTPTFTFGSNQPGITFECSLDGGAFFPCSSPLTLPELAPGLHTFQVRARNADGVVDPTPATFTFFIPKELKDLPPPVLGKLVNAEPVSGSVLYAEPAGSSSARAGARTSQKGLKFIPLREARQIRIGAFFDTRKGRVRLQAATRTKGKTQTGVFYAGLFQTLQSRKRSARGVFELRLKGSSFRRCRTLGHGKRASTARHSKRRIRRLRSNARGRFRTRGRYSAATIRGTVWDTTDRCDGTLTKARRGRVSVRDFRRRKTIVLRRGKSYLARARR